MNNSPLNPRTTAVADPHWTLTQSADPSYATGAALDGGAINPAWYNPATGDVGTSSSWLEGTWGNGNALLARGAYVYTTSFTVPAYVGSFGIPAGIKVAIAVDNAVQSVSGNGHDVTPSNISIVNFTSLAACGRAIPAGVLNAPNTLSLSTLNSGSQPSAQGFLISAIQGTFGGQGGGGFCVGNDSDGAL